MKKEPVIFYFVITCIVISSGLKIARATTFLDAEGIALSSAVSAAFGENFFMINPANFSYDTKAYMSFGGLISTFTAVDLTRTGGKAFGKFVINDFMAVGASLDLDFLNYSGDYPGADGALWSEIKAGIAYNVNIKDFLKLGISGKYVNYGTGAEIHGKSIPRENSFDLGAGILAKIKIIQIGFAANNLLNLDELNSRNLQGGIGLNIKNIFYTSIDTYYDLSMKEIDLDFGLEVRLIRQMLMLRGGLGCLGTFSSFSPSFGAGLNIRRFIINYSGNYNIQIGGSGYHYLSFGVRF